MLIQVLWVRYVAFLNINDFVGTFGSSADLMRHLDPECWVWCVCLLVGSSGQRGHIWPWPHCSQPESWHHTLQKRSYSWSFSGPSLLNVGCRWLYGETDLELVYGRLALALWHYVHGGEKKNVAREAQVTGLLNAHKHALLTTTQGVHRDSIERNWDRER